ncbi:hypothetical protein [Streptomyces sp. NBC_00645]
MRKTLYVSTLIEGVVASAAEAGEAPTSPAAVSDRTSMAAP